MALVKVNWHPSLKELRLFAALEPVFFAIVGWLVAFRFRSPLAGIAIFAIGAAIGVMGLLAPRAIRPVYVLWMAAALPIGWLVSHAAMAGIFFLVITPIGLIMRACGRDPMQRRFDPPARTYWRERAESRETREYFRQY